MVAGAGHRSTTLHVPPQRYHIPATLGQSGISDQQETGILAWAKEAQLARIAERAAMHRSQCAMTSMAVVASCLRFPRCIPRCIIPTIPC